MLNPNDPAFPAEPKTQNDLGITYRGLTKREYFAAMAMQYFGHLSPQGAAKACVESADALIEELSK